MNAKTEVESSGMDTAKLAVSVALIVAGILAFYYFEAESLLFRVLGLLVVVGIAVAITMQTAMGRRVWQFASDSKVEVRKVVWPTRQETIQVTLMVFGMVLITGIVLWLFDMALAAIMRVLTAQGG